GPEGGQGGGTVVAAGTPEEVAQVEASYTGQFLRRVLWPDQEKAAPGHSEPASGAREPFAPMALGAGER
ncbi:MAG: hypothetical protein QJR13_08305, partial [Bacillota bacterium]|nr:hypothetical protein [Bacillota bacterium]